MSHAFAPGFEPATADAPCPDAQTLAALLKAASPSRAPAFAVMMQERACAAADERLRETWTAVAAILNGRA